MKKTEIIMGMPITVEILGEVGDEVFLKVFSFFKKIDKVFSTYKKDSEVSRINRGDVGRSTISSQMKEVLKLAEKTKKETGGFFDVYHKGIFDPSGVVKGWSIQKATELILEMGYENFYIDAGGDIQAKGKNSKGKSWRVGIRNPFNRFENVKLVNIEDSAIATSGTYIRGEHIYNPNGAKQEDVVSISVIGKNIVDADRFATAAFAMGRDGIYFIESLKDFEAYMIDKEGIATFTSGFDNYLKVDGNN